MPGTNAPDAMPSFPKTKSTVKIATLKPLNPMKTITAKYHGKCFECGGPIKPGDAIKYYGSLHSEHAACSDNAPKACEDEAAGLEPGTLANDRLLARQGLSVIRFASGAVVTQNSRGRCEDAPCCGCCS